MKKILITFVSSLLAFTINASAVNSKGNNHKEDTLNIKCLIYSANLFYGIELGEKPVKNMVDTLVSEIPSYDTNIELNLVVVSAKDLGFKNQNKIFWEQILDSAQARGYELCPPQVGPELLVASQNTEYGRTLLRSKVTPGRPVFIGMKKIKHVESDKTERVFFIKNKASFNYVFCIKSSSRKAGYELGYSATNSVKKDKGFIWDSNDLFIFINKPQHAKVSISYSSK